MNKYMFLGAGLCVVMALTSCKSSESAYKKAYLKAQQRTETPTTTETPAVTTETPTVTPVTTTPVTQATVTDNNDGIRVTRDNVNVVNGEPLKAYSVVIGSFTLEANALGECGRLRDKGYNARVVFSSESNSYRVVASSFDTKAEAAQSRDQLSTQFQGAWLLYAK